MLKWEKVVKNVLLENKYDLSSFTEEEITSFKESCKKTILNETKEFDERIRQLLEIWDNCVRNNIFHFDKKTGWLFTVLDTILVVVFPKEMQVVEAGYDVDSNCIYLYANDLVDLKRPEIRLNLAHELEHYLYAQNASEEEKKNMISLGKTREEYYDNEYEFEAHKRAFIMGAEALLYGNLDKCDVETDLKKLPKKNVYEFFKIMETGKCPLDAKWFLSLTDEQRKELLDEMLYKFAESIENNELLCLKESMLIYNYYRNQED